MERERKVPLTVRELIGLLKEEVQDSPVEIEGCDGCSGGAGNVEAQLSPRGEGSVLIERIDDSVL